MCRTPHISPLLGAMFLAALATACVMGPAPVAQAGLLDVRIDFGKAKIPSPAPENTFVPTPANWNLAHQDFMSKVTSNGSEQALTDFNTSATTGVELKVTKAFYPSGAQVDSFSWGNAEAPWVEVDALRDWTMAYSGSGSCQFELIGLDPNEIYNIELLAVRDSGIGLGEYRVNGGPGTVIFGASHGAGITPGTTSEWNSGTDGYTAKGVMIWRNVAPSASGTIVVDVDNLAYSGENGVVAP